MKREEKQKRWRETIITPGDEERAAVSAALLKLVGRRVTGQVTIDLSQGRAARARVVEPETQN